MPIDEIKLDNTVAPQNPTIKPRLQRPNWTRNKKIFASFLGIVGFVAVLVIFFVILPIQATISSAKATYTESKQIYAQVKNQDLIKTEEEISKTKVKLASTKSNLNKISWIAVIPFVGDYVSDGKHLLNAAGYGLDGGDILVKAALPYADLLGLKGKGTFTGGTTEERIQKMVETLDKVSPEFDKVADKLDLVKKEVDQVDPNRYPETFQGKPIKSTLVDAKKVLDAVDEFLSQARPMMKKLPGLMGATGEQKYMVLFQNDGELRPTGGFITAYATFRIEKGKINLDTSDDIYKLDDTITKRITPPGPISKYLNVFGWRLRDSNFSPDFFSSMKTFEDLYNSSSQKKQIAGIIAMDTHVLLKLMDVIGPISIYGTNYTTKIVPQCNCPMVIYELEKYADEPKAYERGSRKDIIGVLLSEMMKKTLSAPKQLLGNLIPVMVDEANSKHVLVYLHDTDAQAGVEALNLGGRIKSYGAVKDYLHVNDANLGGAKSNLYIKEKVDLTVTTSPDKTDNNLLIQYQHPQPPDNCSLERKVGLCLSGIYRDYVRAYLPKGSTVVETRGFESKSTVFEDLDHTVVDGFFTVVPMGLAKIQIKYTTPVKAGSKYILALQKQPGTGEIPYTVTVNGKTKNFTLTSDTEVVF